MKTIIILIQTLFIIAASPLISGLIRKIKNTLRMRIGASIFQPYYNLIKLFAKEETVSENTSWIFRFTPLIVFASVVTASLLVPALISPVSFNMMGDFLLIIFLLALGRFFMALAGLDAASAFGGMGSSREMFISGLAEPVAILSVFTVSISHGSTSLFVITNSAAAHFSTIIASFSLLMVLIAETSRVPVDNQETHLELTMVHEAMVLEYSGRSLALIEWASHIKQIIFFSLIANVMLPWTMPIYGGALSVAAAGFAVYILKMAAIAVIVAVIEVSVAKMRLFRVVDFMGFAFILSLAAVVSAALGL
ncbi:MAG: NADH-quinone oxidoreductase subunit H [Candidatus Omnitrophota bacterium]